MTVVDFVNTVPRFPSKVTRDGCDARCKPVMYTDQVLFNRCKKDFRSRLCLEDGRLTVGFLTSLLFDTSFTTFRFCLLMYKIATDQRFVTWRRCLFIVTTVFAV